MKPALRFALVIVLPALALAVGCAERTPIPPPPRDVRVVTVLPANNRTGEDLIIAGASLIETYVLPAARVAVPDVLAAEAGALLRTRGYRVTDAALGGRAPASAEDAARLAGERALAGFVLYLEIRRWEADAGTHPAFVIVGVSAILMDVAGGREVWSARLPVHPIATPGAVTLGTAYEIAARAVVGELLASWPS